MQHDDGSTAWYDLAASEVRLMHDAAGLAAVGDLPGKDGTGAAALPAQRATMMLSLSTDEQFQCMVRQQKARSKKRRRAQLVWRAP